MKFFSTFLFSLCAVVLTMFPFALHGDEFDLGIFGQEEKAVTFNLKGTFYSKVVADYYRDNPYEDFFEWRNKLFVEADFKLPKRWEAFGSVRIDYNVLASEDRGRGQVKFDVYELYVKKTFGNFDLYLGKTTVTWGLADVSQLDIVNPRDFTEGPFLETEFSKVPLVMARLIYYPDDFTELEGVIIPFYRPVKFELVNTDWSLITPEMLSESDMPQDLGGVDALRDGRVNPFVKDYPPDAFFPPELGFRFTRRGGKVDYTVVLFAGYTDFPLPQFNPDYVRALEIKNPDASAEEKLFGIELVDMITYSKPMDDQDFSVLKPEYGFFAGGGLSTDLKGFGVRGEIFSNLPGYFIGQNLEIVKEPTIGFNTGVDKQFLGDHVYINIFYQGIFVPGMDEDLFLTERINHMAGGILRLKWDDWHISAEAGFTVDFTFGDFLIAPRLSYEVSDVIKVNAGTQILSGDRESPFGYFRENSAWYIQMRWIL